LKVECCDCGNEYPLEGNLFETSPVRQQPLLVCPHCGLEHLLSFLPVPPPFNPPAAPERPQVHKLNLGQTYYAALHSTRIASATRVDQSGSNDGDVTGWDRVDDFIVATLVYADKDVGTRNFKLQWRDVTEEGAFADVAATGEINYNADTDLTDNAWTASGTYLMNTLQGSPYFWGGITDNEGDNTLSRVYGPEVEYEHQWGLDGSGADYSHQYAFQLWDVTIRPAAAPAK
jgi:hypothetical protein